MDSVEALGRRMLGELRRGREQPGHASVRLLFHTQRLPNGVDHCTVQMICDVGCRFVIESYGSLAAPLRDKAAEIQQALGGGICRPSVSDIAGLFPKLVDLHRVHPGSERVAAPSLINTASVHTTPVT